MRNSYFQPINSLEMQLTFNANVFLLYLLILLGYEEDIDTLNMLPGNLLQICRFTGHLFNLLSYSGDNYTNYFLPVYIKYGSPFSSLLQRFPYCSSSFQSPCCPFSCCLPLCPKSQYCIFQVSVTAVPFQVPFFGLSYLSQHDRSPQCAYLFAYDSVGQTFGQG